eukprot:14860780-Ditylum_brightwellii.AAC.1
MSSLVAVFAGGAGYLTPGDGTVNMSCVSSVCFRESGLKLDAVSSNSSNSDVRLHFQSPEGECRCWTNTTVISTKVSNENF